MIQHTWVKGLTQGANSGSLVVLELEPVILQLVTQSLNPLSLQHLTIFLEEKRYQNCTFHHHHPNSTIEETSDIALIHTFLLET